MRNRTEFLHRGYCSLGYFFGFIGILSNLVIPPFKTDVTSAEAYKYVRKLGRLSDPQELAVLREVAAWREMTARLEDRSPSLVGTFLRFIFIFCFFVFCF